jgi:rsbT co-antagonist protein RsbR
MSAMQDSVDVLRERIAALERELAETRGQDAVLQRAEMVAEVSARMSRAADEQEILVAMEGVFERHKVDLSSLTYLHVDADNVPQVVENVALRAQGQPVPLSTLPQVHLPIEDFPVIDIILATPDTPTFVENIETDPRCDENIRAYYRGIGMAAGIAVPLKSSGLGGGGGRWQGLMTFNWAEPRRFDEDIRALFIALQPKIADVVAGRRAYLAEQAARRQSELLYTLSQGLSTARDEEALLQVVSQPAIEAGASFAELNYFDLDEADTPQWVTCVACWQREGEPIATVGERDPLMNSPFINLWLAEPEKPLLVETVAEDERMDETIKALLDPIGAQAMVQVLLRQAGRWVGALSFIWDEPHTFNADEIAFYNALPILAAPAVENLRLLNNLERMVKARTDEVAIFRALADNAPYGISLATFEGNEPLYVNRALYTMLGYDYDERALLHHGALSTVFPPDEVDRVNDEILPQLMQRGEWQGEVQYQRKNGETFPALVTVFLLLHDDEEKPPTVVTLSQDITERKRVYEERERLQEEVIEAQKEALEELSTPVIPVLDRILVMPLVGSIDSMRARDIMRALLEGINAHRAKVVILDVTGVPVMDTGVVNHINKTIQAARLKGARTIVTGISDAVAEAIVDLGIDWGAVETLRDLQTGLVMALNSLGVRMYEG